MIPGPPSSLAPAAADPLEILADALTEYEIAREMANHKHPDNEGAHLIAAHKFAAVKVALNALNRRKERA